MAERVRQSHVVATHDTTIPILSVRKTQSARMWALFYVADASHAYNVSDFTLHCGRYGAFPFALVAQTASVSKPQSAIKKTHLPGFALAHDGYLFLDEGPTHKPQADDWQNILI
jgi:hypothetical protein